MMKSALGWGFSCLSLGLLACQGDSEGVAISSTQAALTASENSERTLQGILDAADFLSESASLAQALNAFGGSQQCESSGVFCPDATSCPPPEVTCTTDTLDEADLEAARTELREDLTELVETLRERVLIPENLESETETSATYRLGPSVLCGDTAAPGAAPSYDPDCVEQVDRWQPRLRLTSPRDGDVDLAVLIGENRHSPLVFELHQHSLGVRVDLGEALDVARDLGEDTQDLRDLSGVLQLQLVEHRARDYSLELNVLQAVSAVVDVEGGSVEVSLAATSPALELRLDGNAQALTAGMDLGALRVLGPLGAFADLFGGSDAVSSSGTGGATGSFDVAQPAPAEPPEPPSYHGILEMFLAGLSGSASYAAASDVLTLSHLGFGDATSSIQHDGRTLFALDLNPDSGRHLDLTLEPEGEDTRIRITPGLDLRLSFAFHYIADQFEDLSDALLDDRWRIWFEGANPAVVTRPEALQVESGTLHLESAADPSASLSVAAGMCLLESSSSGETAGSEGHWLHELTSGACE